MDVGLRKGYDKAYMDMGSIKQEWGQGKAWIDNFTRDFPMLLNLADGIAINYQSKAPQVGTVTLANSVRQIPRNSAQQFPVLSCQINGTKLSLDSIIATYLLRNVVFSPDTFGNGVLETVQMALQTALSTGFAPLRANVGRNFNKFSTMLESLHYNDIVIEPGVFDASNSSYFHVRTRVTKGQLKQLIADAKANPKTVWNVPALQRLYDAGPGNIDYNRFQSTPRQNAGMGENQFDLVTRYGVGAYYPITVYSPQLTDSDDDILMDIESKSKFGYPRLSLLVVDPDQLSPFGISRTRLASPMKTYGDIYLQSTAKMQLLNADPPVFKKGLFSTPTPLRRGVTYESLDPNADIKLMEMSNTTLEQFTSVMGYIDSNILNTMGVTAVGPQPASPSVYQNTEQTQAVNTTTSLASAQVTIIAENAIRQYGLTALDLYISEQVGQTALIVDDEAKDAINQIMPPNPDTVDPATGAMIPGTPFVGDDNVVNIDWQAYYDRIQTWTVTVDLSISPDQMEKNKQATLQDAVTVASQTADPNDPQAVAQKNALQNELIESIAPEAAKQVQGMPQQPQAPPANIPAVGGALTPQT